MSLTFDGAGLADGIALAQVRAGHPAAFGVLYERHLDAARRLARSLVSSPADADDIVAEVFAATLAAIRRGRGPETDFAPYLLRSVRRECQRTWRRTGSRGDAPIDDAPDDRVSDDADDFARTDEAQVLHDAFTALPTRMRDVLWQVEVDGRSHEEIARRTRSTPQAVAQQVVRARRALSARYLQAHLGTGEMPVPPECASTREALAEFIRGTTSATRQRAVAEHLGSCPACREARDHLELVNERLRGALLLGLASAAAVPRPWVIGLVARATGWISVPTAPLAVATSIALLSVVAPPPVFEARPPEAEAAAPEVMAVAVAPEPDEARSGRGPAAGGDVVLDAAALERSMTLVTVADEPLSSPASALAAPAAIESAPVAAPPPPAPTSSEPTAGADGRDDVPLVAPVAEVLDPVTAPLAPVVAPVTAALDPVVATLDPVVAPVTVALDPVTTAVAPVTNVVGGLEPVTGPVLDPVADVVAPVVEPVAAVVEPVAAVVADPLAAVVEPVAAVVAEPVAAGAANVVAPVATAPPVTSIGDALTALGG